MVDTVVVSLGVSLAINKLTDLSYGLTFMVVILISASRMSTLSTYSIVLISMVCVWALRIGSFLLVRVMGKGKDDRFDGVLEHFWKFEKFWFEQAVTVWILLLPATLALSRPNKNLGLTAFMGIVL